VRAANALTARWAAGWRGGSTVLSGAGVWPLLAALQGGAAGATATELSAATGLPDGAEALAGARGLWGALDGAVDARAALGLWWRAVLELRAEWVAGLPAGSHGSLSGDPGVDQARLDAWVVEQTGGLLRRMPVAVDADTMLVLASALTVRTAWAEPFQDQPMDAGPGPWQGLGRLAGLFRSGTDLDAVAVLDTPAGPVTALTVAGAGDVDVHLLLGEPERAAGEVLPAGLGAVAGAGRRGSDLPLGAEAPGLRVVEVRSFSGRPVLEARCVRFEVTGGHDLLARADLFGLRSASDDKAAEFPGISDTGLYVSAAEQDAVATFSATGFEAAAVTSMGLQTMAAPAGTARAVRVTFDRPFGFAAVHRPTGLVLVAGWVADPERAVAGASW
jgi:hypothetical protein